MLIATWNVNSVKQRLAHLLKFLTEAKPDVLCLQETKCPDDAFPLKALRGSGYEHVMFAGQKGYNGVAILSRFPLHTRSVMGFCERADARHISAVLGPEVRALFEAAAGPKEYREYAADHDTVTPVEARTDRIRLYKR